MTATIPLDDFILTLIEEALDATLTVDGDGNHVRTGGQFSMPRLLDFFAGYDPRNLTELGDGVSEYTGLTFDRDDLIRALVTEVRRLRS